MCRALVAMGTRAWVAMGTRAWVAMGHMAWVGFPSPSQWGVRNVGARAFFSSVLISYPSQWGVGFPYQVISPLFQEYSRILFTTKILPLH